MAAEKRSPVLLCSVVIFSGPSGSLSSALVCVENSVPLKPMLGGVRDVALLYYPSCTDSNKPSLQFPRNCAVFYVSEGSYFYQIFVIFNVSSIEN
jgi:hypothetical protein